MPASEFVNIDQPNRLASYWRGDDWLGAESESSRGGRLRVLSSGQGRFIAG